MPYTFTRLSKKYKTQKLSTGLSPDTVDRVIENTRMLLTDIGVEDVRELDTDVILSWGEVKLMQSQVRKSTLSTYYNSIRSFVRYAHLQGHKTKVDLDQIRCSPKYRQKRVLTPRRIRRVITYSDIQTAVLVDLMYTSGMRISEAISIQQSHLTDTVMYISGKGSKIRPVIITKDLLDRLRIMSSINDGYCFVDKDGQPLSRKKAYYYIKKSMAEAGYDWASPHTLRHSYCTELLRKGADLSVVSRMMGHSSVAVTQVYTHLITSDLEHAHKKYLTLVH